MYNIEVTPGTFKKLIIHLDDESVNLKYIANVVYNGGALFSKECRHYALDLQESLTALIQQATEGLTIELYLGLLAYEKYLRELLGQVLHLDNDEEKKAVRAARSARRKDISSIGFREAK